MNNKKKTFYLTVTALLVGSIYIVISDSFIEESTVSLEEPATKIGPELAQTRKPASLSASQSEASAPNPSDIAPTDDSSFFDDLFLKDDRAWAWAKVNLEDIRRDIPNNLYWALAAPTNDASLLEQRQEQKNYWDNQRTRVSSKVASDEEIRDYFTHQHNVSNDYIEFATLLLNRHGHDLSEQDYAMQTLARNMHLSRLEEIPGKLTKALQNREKHIQNRQSWIADEEAYETKLMLEKEKALRALGKI